MHLPTISKRGLIASQTALRSDMDLYFRALSNMYHPDDNPDGDFPLNVAENKLNWSMLKAKMEDVTKEKSIPHWVAGYTSSLGHEGFREIVSGFLSRYLAKYPISAHQIALSAGATSVIEVTSWILGDAGDVAVFPAPCYPVYKQDIGNKAAIERYDLITHHDNDELNKGLILTQAHLEKTKQDITESGKQMKMLVLTQPDNPTGSIYTKDQLEMAAQWCIQNEIHLIVNEIYGLCLLDINDSSITNDYDDPIVFTSFTEMIHQYNSPYLHLWYALSKDLGISGMRIGLLYTHNELLLRAYENLNAPSMISNHTQWLLGEILSDYTFMDLFLSKQKQSLTEVYVLVTMYLKKLNIPFVPSYGSLFIWADFSQFLEHPSQEAEHKFWVELYEHTGILFTPGDGFGHSKRGMFRIVYSCFDKFAIEVAMNRLLLYINTIVLS